MTNSNKVRVSKLAIGLAIALSVAPAFAQNTTSAMAGRVSDAGGNAITGAQVTIVHTESGSVSNATTDAEGRYAARGLRVGGPYTVTITKDGKTETREGVYIELAQTASVDLRIEDATTLSAVQVTGTRTSDLFDSKKMGAGTSINREKLNSLASIQRNLQDYARTDIRISQTDKGRGEISAGGQNSRYNSITIDGVATSDTFGLESNNLPTLKQPISIDAIQSVQVNISNFDVTQTGYTGANINAVTKSGTNEFKGSVYYVYRDENAIGKRYNRASNVYSDFPAFEESTIGAILGGPIIEDTLFFFANYEELNSSRTTPSFGPLGGLLTNVGITNSAIAGAQTVATGYGFNAGDLNATAVELTVKDYLLKLDANLGENHRANLRWSKTEQTEPFYLGFGARSLSLSSHWYVQEKTIETLVGQVFSDWTDNFSTELKVTNRKYESEPLNNSNLPQISLNFTGALPPGTPTSVLTGTRSLLLGTERSRQFNELDTDTLNVYAAGNWFVGDHELKFGIDYSDNEIFNAFLQDTRGNYSFGCINSSAAVPYTTTGGAVVCSDIRNSAGVVITPASSGAVIQAAVLENFQRGRPLTYQAQVAAPGLTIQNGAADWSYQNLGLFLQDTWSVNDKLTLTYGFRVDKASMDQSPLFNAAAAAAAIAGTLTGATTPQTGVTTRASGGFGVRNDVTLDGNSLIQPRFGFNYTFDHARPMQLRGGFGLFEGAAANVWLSNPYSNTGLSTRIVGCGGTGFGTCSTAGGLFSANPSTQPILTGTPPLANVDLLSTELAQPSVWKFNLAFEHELPFWGMTFSAEYIRTEVNDAIYYKQLNLGQATRRGTDGRELYYRPSGFNTACWGDFGTAITTGACAVPTGQTLTRALSNNTFNNVLLAERTGKGGGDNLSFTLSGRFLEDWTYTVGYAYTSATEVSALTSSTSNSNWQARSIFNSNEEVDTNSAYLVRDRFIGQLNYKHNFFGNYATRFGLVYEGRKGKPYSWIYDNDLNGDGAANDLLYIPTALGSNQVVFRDLNANGSGTDEEARFWSVVNSNGLARYAGGAVERNSHFAPWTHSFDVRISQEFPGFFEGNKTSVVLDILNIGNMINKKWGRVDEVSFSGTGGVSRSFVNYLGLDAQGRYIYGVNGQVEDYFTRQDRGESQWGAQLTVKYEF
jgi:Carboxypeptidase regulatory-like domain